MSAGDIITALSAHVAVWGQSVYKASLVFGQTMRGKTSLSFRKGFKSKSTSLPLSFTGLQVAKTK